MKKQFRLIPIEHGYRDDDWGGSGGENRKFHRTGPDTYIVWRVRPKKDGDYNIITSYNKEFKSEKEAKKFVKTLCKKRSWKYEIKGQFS